MQSLWVAQEPRRALMLSASDRTAVARFAPLLTAVLVGAWAWASPALGRADAASTAVETIVLLLIVAPPVEELLFRWGVQDGLEALGASPAVALCGSALSFAVLHGLCRSWVLGVAVLLPGLAFAVLYRRGRRLRSCVLAHAAANALWLFGSPAVFSVGIGS